MQSNVEFDSATGLYRIGRDHGEPLSTNIVLSVAAIEGVRPTELPPLAHTLDPDALDQLFHRTENAAISFSYAGYHVSIHDAERIEITSVDETRALTRN
ncbi:HalOD1 output domain-containing protein (plasmid) [Haloferax sp. S1W]|uniref:HalOD1 output domain-containing protein n=1 Tax=Haloferax sp. S1W TaxID=3377110 RepID=UPI0037CB62EA